MSFHGEEALGFVLVFVFWYLSLPSPSLDTETDLVT